MNTIRTIPELKKELKKAGIKFESFTIERRVEWHASNRGSKNGQGGHRSKTVKFSYIRVNGSEYKLNRVFKGNLHAVPGLRRIYKDIVEN